MNEAQTKTQVEEQHKELCRELQTLSNQLQLQQQHVRLIQDVAFKTPNDADLVPILHRSLRGVQCSQLLNYRAFEVPCDYVYVLQLEGEHFYVGYSANLPNRIYQHFTGDGALWTKKHRPLKIVEVVLGDKSVEKEKTLQYMTAKGFQKVRGWAWCAINLDNPPKDLNLNKVQIS